MEVFLDLRSVVILMILFSGIDGRDAEVAESLPSRVFVRKSFHYPGINNQMSSRVFLRERPKFWDSQLIPTVDPQIDSLCRTTAYLIDTMRRLELKFDRVIDVVNLEENVAIETMNKLKLIYQYIKSTPTNTYRASSVNEMPQNDLMRELVDAVKYSNDNMKKLVTNFDTVMESGTRSMQSLDRVVSTVQDIDERTIRIQQTSCSQFSGGRSHLIRDETVGSANPSSTMSPRVDIGSNNYEINEPNNNFPTSSNQPAQHLVTQTNYDSTDRRVPFSDNKNASIVRTASTYESTGGEVNSWGSNSQTNFNNYGDKNRNTDGGHQFVTGIPTNYDSNSNGRLNGDDHSGKSFVSSMTYESTGGDVQNLGRSSQANGNEYREKNRNTDRGHQSATGTTTIHDSNGRVNSEYHYAKEVKENTNVSHNQEKRNDFENSEIINHHKTPILSKPSVPEVSNWNSYETFVGGSNRNHNIGQINKDRTVIQQTQPSYESKDGGAIFDIERPVDESSSSSSFESSNGEIRSWDSSSYKSSNQGKKSGAAHADNYDSITSDVSDQNKKPVTAPSKKNLESSGIAVQSHSSNVQLKEKENVVVTHNRTSYDSGGSVVIDRNVNPIVTSTTVNHEPDKTEVYNSNRLTSGTKEKEVIDQKTGIVAPTTSNGASSTTSKSKEQSLGSSTNGSTTLSRKITTTTSTTTTTTKPTTTTTTKPTTTTTTKPTTTTTTRPTTTTTTTTSTTAKPQTSANTANSPRTYRSLRKNVAHVTFEPDKRNCHDLTVKKNGIYKFGSQDEIANDGNRFFYERYCDFFTDNRAWTVIQRRWAEESFSEESFNRTWGEYKHGFGSLDDEFWFGNDFIHNLTFSDDVELRILLKDEKGEGTNWVEYSLFKMKSEKDNYKLVIGGYSSGPVEDNLLYHNDQEFSTYDHRNGNSQQTSCASSIGNGWWFKDCSDKDILGNFLGSTSTKMMIRPKK